MRDANGSIRIADRGNVPISDLDMQQEQRLLGSNGYASDKTYQRLLIDINLMV